jgi:stage II sporulation protein D
MKGQVFIGFIEVFAMDKRLVRFLVVLAIFLVLLGVLAALAACNSGDETGTADYPLAFVRDGALDYDGMIGTAPLTPVGDDIPISRGLMAKMIALTFAELKDINEAARVIGFNDTEPQDWYDKYINKAYTLGYLSGIGASFFPESPLTLEQAQFILDRLDPNNAIRIQLTAENRHMAISYALWVSLYRQLLGNIGALSDSSSASSSASLSDSSSASSSAYSSASVEEVHATVLITPNFNPSLPLGHIITDKGHYSAVGLDFEDYLDKEISVLVRDREILAIVGLSNPTPILRNVFVADITVADANPPSITVFCGGAGRAFTFLGDVSDLRVGSVADVIIQNGSILAIRPLNQRISGVIKEVGNGFVEIESYGRINTHGSFALFSMLQSPVTVGRLSQLTIGYDVADFILRDGEIAAAVILRRAVPSHIRVVLSTTGFGGLVHSAVSLRSACGLRVFGADGVISEIAAGEIFSLTNQNAYLLGGGRIRVEPLGGSVGGSVDGSVGGSGDGKIEILSISRNWPSGANPQYRGVLEISGRAGGFVIVNQLPLEEYLYSVIPSEMPSSFGLEAAKVQAITARSYAYAQFFDNRHYAYGANVDDSVMTQVYNNIPETPLAIEAVNATRGILLTYAGSVVSANFFSTSSGHTADRGDVWLNFETGDLDAETPHYLRGMPQYFGPSFGELSLEQNARAFFKNTAIEGYDDHSPWFRWNFEVTPAELGLIINNNLPRLAGNSPHLFVPVGDDGFPPHTITNIGEFVGMEVKSRGRGGNVTELLVNGSAGGVLVRTEYAIRQLLTPSLPKGITLNRHNAAAITNHFILPSTFMVFETSSENGSNGNIIFYGGGFGHGVGMSQHGVFGMVQRGYTYREILAHFYPGTVLNDN